MQLRARIWLADDQHAGFLGQGRYRLLRQIDQHHCLRKAAADLGISYRKAWGDIRAIEQRLGFPLVIRHRGGSTGGTSELTDQARQLLDAYNRACAAVEKKLQTEYDHHLKSLLEPTDQTDISP